MLRLHIRHTWFGIYSCCCWILKFFLCTSSSFCPQDKREICFSHTDNAHLALVLFSLPNKRKYIYVRSYVTFSCSQITNQNVVTQTRFERQCTAHEMRNIQFRRITLSVSPFLIVPVPILLFSQTSFFCSKFFHRVFNFRWHIYEIE